MIWGIYTAWLYAYAPGKLIPTRTYYTVFVSGPREPQMNGQSVLAQISLSYLTTLDSAGAGAGISSYQPPFGAPVEFEDPKFNSLFANDCLSVTFELVAIGAEAYAQASVTVFD
jgi:hypothetical protein